MLKTLCLLGVIFAHAAMPFVEPPEFLKIYADTPDYIANQIILWVDFIVIPSFMFASGYVMALTLERQRRAFIQQVINRAKRLLLPWGLVMIFWMVPLYTLFDIPAYNRPEGFTLAQTYRVGLTGLFNDHLWFLLVLFWVSLFWLAARPLLKRFGLVFGSVLAVAAALLIDTFGRGLTLYALWEIPGPLIYFYLGYGLYCNRERVDTLIKKRPSALLAGNAVLLILLSRFVGLHSVIYWAACCAGTLLAYQVCLLMSPVCAALRENALYRYFEDNALRFYLFHMPSGLLTFKALYALGVLPPLPLVFLSFVLNLAITALIVTAINALERKTRVIIGY
jgi:hypothetical protein